MHLTELVLENWKCYAGENRLALEPKVYAIVGRFDHDARRSNWSGKSSVVEAVAWLLTGSKPDDVETFDDLIHRGESGMRVEARLSDGTHVARSKKRGRSVVLVVTDPDGVELTSTGAQKYVDENVVDSSMFYITNYMRQHRAGELVRIKNADLFKTVSGWFGIDEVERACEFAREKLANVVAGERRSRERFESLEVEDVEELRRRVEELQADIETQNEEIARYADDERRAARYEKLEREAAKYRKAVEDLNRLAKPEFSLKKMQRVEAAVDSAKAEHVAARDQSRKLKVLAQGEFDGVCPVAGIDCPAKDEINDDRFRHSEEYRKQSAVEARLKTERVKREDELREFERKRDAANRYEREKAVLEERVAGLKDVFDEFEKIDRPAEDAALDMKKKRGALEQAVAERALCTKRIETAEDAGRVKKRLAEEIAQAVAHRRVWRQAVDILGKSGVQKTLVDENLGGILSEANAVLEDCGQGLSIGLRWEKETQELTDVCNECGSPLPASRRVKACDNCGTPRGKKMSFKPRMVLSDVSGGAKAFAGAVFQFSAAAWLRDAYQIGLGTFVVDEPFESLDPVNATELGRRTMAVLSQRFGFEQVFVIAHHRDVLEAAPGRIEVARADGRSTVTVA